MIDALKSTSELESRPKKKKKKERKKKIKKKENSGFNNRMKSLASF